MLSFGIWNYFLLSWVVFEIVRADAGVRQAQEVDGEHEEMKQRAADEAYREEKRQLQQFTQYNPFAWISGIPPVEQNNRVVGADGKTYTFTQYDPYPFTPIAAPTPTSQSSSLTPRTTSSRTPIAIPSASSSPGKVAQPAIQSSISFTQYDPFPFTPGATIRVGSATSISFTQYDPFPFTPGMTIVVGPTSSPSSPSVATVSSPSRPATTSSRSPPPVQGTTSLPNYNPTFPLPSSRSPLPPPVSMSQSTRASVSVVQSPRPTSTSLPNYNPSFSSYVRPTSSSTPPVVLPVPTPSSSLAQNSRPTSTSLPNYNPSFSPYVPPTSLSSTPPVMPSFVTVSQLPSPSSRSNSIVTPWVMPSLSATKSSWSPSPTVTTSVTGLIQTGVTLSTYLISGVPSSAIPSISSVPAVVVAPPSSTRLPVVVGGNSTSSALPTTTPFVVIGGNSTSLTTLPTSTPLPALGGNSTSAKPSFFTNTGAFNGTSSRAPLPVPTSFNFTRTFTPTSGFMTNGIGNTTATPTTLITSTTGFVMNSGMFNGTTTSRVLTSFSSLTRTFLPTSGFMTNGGLNVTSTSSFLGTVIPLSSSTSSLSRISSSSSSSPSSSLTVTSSSSTLPPRPTTTSSPPPQQQPATTPSPPQAPPSSVSPASSTLSTSTGTTPVLMDSQSTAAGQQGATSAGGTQDTKLVVALSVTFVGIAIVLGVATFFFLRYRRRRRKANAVTANSMEKGGDGGGSGKSEGSALLGGAATAIGSGAARRGTVRTMRDMTGRDGGAGGGAGGAGAGAGGGVMRVMSGMFGGGRSREGERTRRSRERRQDMMDGEMTPRDRDDDDDDDEEDMMRRQTERRGIAAATYGANGSTQQLLNYGSTSRGPERRMDEEEEEGRSSNETVRDSHGHESGRTRSRSDPDAASIDSWDRTSEGEPLPFPGTPIIRMPRPQLEVRGAPQIPRGNYAVTTYSDPFEPGPTSPVPQSPSTPTQPLAGSSTLRHHPTSKSMPGNRNVPPASPILSPSTASLYGSNFRQNSMGPEPPMSPEEAQRLGFASFLPPIRNPFRRDSGASRKMPEAIRDPRPPPTMTVEDDPFDDDARGPPDVPLPASSDGHGSAISAPRLVEPQDENRGILSGLISVFRSPSMDSLVDDVNTDESPARLSTETRTSADRLSLPRLQPPTQRRFDPWETDYGTSQDASPIDPYGRFDIPGFRPPTQSTSYPKTPLDPRQNPFRRGSQDSFYDSEAGSLPPGGGTLFVANDPSRR
ncbi:hypothetical protein BT69DRAFT_1333562 [Atractiella rhizophila]|nr:hypothetical protein BT69DRAFT_1333562 [Atractiella rhizophila]